MWSDLNWKGKFRFIYRTIGYKMKKSKIGTKLDDVLEQDGTLAEVETSAKKKAVAARDAKPPYRLTDKLIRMVQLYVQRGSAGRDVCLSIYESLWIDYEWGFHNDDIDAQLAINAAETFKSLVLDCKDEDKACIRASRMEDILE